MSRVRINLGVPGIYHRPPTPPRKYGAPVPDHVMPGFDKLNDPLESHIEFHFQTRLRQELRLHDPQQPFPEDPLPDELTERGEGAEERGVTLPQARADAALSDPTRPQKAVRDLTARLQHRQKAQCAAQQEERFRKIQADFQRQCSTCLPLPCHRNITVAEGGAMDPALIEDREYKLGEITGPGSRFCFRLIPWGAGVSRAIHARDKSMVVLLGGRPRNPTWWTHVVKPATAECDIAQLSIQQSPEEKAAKIPPVLSGGVGDSFHP
ncbi:hypothetical protein C8R45DRAFT_929926 [Mycena sanguinolenta]|nr:hypothetical protein C8R45DRAFT_929926 [Mycena sanguinolenta]